MNDACSYSAMKISENPICYTTLSDGTSVMLRPLTEADRGATAEAYRRLSPEARYQRFWTKTGEELSDQMLNRLLHQDPAKHMTWVLLDPSREFPPVGGASWWRNPTDETEAELSAMVLEEDHGRGIGTLLLAVIWLSAQRAGVQELVGYTLATNRKAAHWMRDCGATGEWDGAQLCFRWNLNAAANLPQTAAGKDLAARLKEFTLG
jgi:GNAT superfamily N-acetyltransferase